MRILVYGFSENKGGKEEFMINLNSISIKENIFYDYIVNGKKCFYEDRITKMGGNIYFYNYSNIFQRLVNLYKILKSNYKAYDYLYFNTSGLYFIMPLLYAKIFGLKIIVHAHSGKEPKLKKILKMLNFINRSFVNKYADFKFQCSDVAGTWIFGKNAKNVIQINNGIDLDKYIFNSDIRNNIRKEYNISENSIILMNIGRMDYPKNQKFLIDLMPLLDNNYKLFLVGTGNDLNYLKKYVENNNIKNILFLGNRNDVNELLQAADIFLMPSFFEGFPIAAIEAQVSGLKCILSDTITKQAKITKTVTYLSIDDSESWITEIINADIKKRINNIKILREKNFDKKDSALQVIKLLNSKK